MATIPQITSISKFHGDTIARVISHAFATIKTITTKTIIKR
ncbi:hypothetical protein [Paraburkholderia caballeronis]|nr:hypothetical protein [Paraburkholderia caballeronis]